MTEKKRTVFCDLLVAFRESLEYGALTAKAIDEEIDMYEARWQEGCKNDTQP